MFKILGAVFVLLVVFVLICYSQGWVQMNNEGDTSSIKIKKNEIKKATERAVEKGEKVLGEAADKIRDFANDKDSSKKENPKESADYGNKR